jgi:hypothetical protein
MPDNEDLDAGLEAFLRADTTLTSLAPGGVWFDFLPQGVTGVAVLYRIQAGDIAPTHDRRGHEGVIYQITACRRDTSAVGVVAAAKRIRALLEGARFDVTGYVVVSCELYTEAGPVRFVEPDGDQRIHHRGRIWEIRIAPRP